MVKSVLNVALRGLVCATVVHENKNIGFVEAVYVDQKLLDILDIIVTIKLVVNKLFESKIMLQE